MEPIDIFAKITGVKYTPLLCRELKYWNYRDLDIVLSKKGNFILEIDSTKQIAVSWWVTPKRTRTYPYARVYDTLNFAGNKVTVIPILKDEGKRGDRDYIQWDTISLMSLLGVHVIISYYVDASRNPRYANKITKQRFDTEHIRGEINRLMSYQSGALHWNMEQAKNIGKIGSRALEAYWNISERLNVEMHSWEDAEDKINKLSASLEEFMTTSRDLAKQAQKRESVTIQPKERVTGIKGTVTIKIFSEAIII